MTEPVVYRYRMSELESWQYLACKPSKNFHWRYVEPLYTAEQLHLKWFVRAKKQMSDGKYLYLENSILNNLAPEYHQIKLTYAQQFDTKEEAEKWTNPLTEAVQLPVEGD